MSKKTKLRKEPLYDVPTSDFFKSEANEHADEISFNKLVIMALVGISTVFWACPLSFTPNLDQRNEPAGCL